MINIKKIRPMSNYLVTTKDVYTEGDSVENGLVVKKVGAVKEVQKVVAVGPMVRNISVGDLVIVNPRRYAAKKYEDGSLKDGVITENPVVKYMFNVIPLNHVEHLLLTEQDIDFVIEEYEEEQENSDLFVPKKKVIV